MPDWKSFLKAPPSRTSISSFLVFLLIIVSVNPVFRQNKTMENKLHNVWKRKSDHIDFKRFCQLFCSRGTSCFSGIFCGDTMIHGNSVVTSTSFILNFYVAVHSLPDLRHLIEADLITINFLFSPRPTFKTAASLWDDKIQSVWLLRWSYTAWIWTELNQYAGPSR